MTRSKILEIRKKNEFPTNRIIDEYERLLALYKSLNETLSKYEALLAQIAEPEVKRGEN